MLKFRKDIAQTMIQIESAKTIVFSVKMFGYASRIRFGKFIPFPKEIPIPIDSRLQLIFKHVEKEPEQNIEDFYQKLAESLDIAPLHLDAILWLNHTYIIKQVLHGLSQETKDMGFEVV
jgi:DNA-(apurinic or apyrimidinic site) lyase